MKVKQLIAELQKVNPEAEVFIWETNFGDRVPALAVDAWSEEAVDINCDMKDIE